MDFSELNISEHIEDKQQSQEEILKQDNLLVNDQNFMDAGLYKAVADEAAKEAMTNQIPAWKDKSQHTLYTNRHKDEQILESNKRINNYLADSKLSPAQFKLKPEVIEQLKIKRDRNNDQLLLNSSKFFWSDSKEMRSVKKCVAELDTNLMQVRSNVGQPVNWAEKEHLMEQYASAIDACHKYVTNPKKNSENSRYKAVKEKLVQLIAEQGKMSSIFAKIDWIEANGKNTGGYEGERWTTVLRLTDLLIAGPLHEESLNAQKNDEKLIEQSDVNTLEKEMKAAHEFVCNENALKTPATVSLPTNNIEDPAGKLLLDLLSGNLATPLVINDGQEASAIKSEQNIRIAQYMFNQLTNFAPGQTLYIDTAVLFAGVVGSNLNKYTDKKNKQRYCDSVIRLHESVDGKMYLSYNGQDETEIPGKQVIITYLTSKIYDCQEFMDKNKSGFESGIKGEQAGKETIDEALRYLEKVSFDEEADYSGKEYKKISDMVYTLTMKVLNNSVKGIDTQSMLKYAKIQDMVKAMVYIVKNPLVEDEPEDKDAYVVKVQALLGIKNMENMVYDNQDLDYATLLKNCNGDEKAVKDQALDFVSKITQIYRDASQFKEMSAEQLHKDAQALSKGTITSIEYMRNMLKNNEKRFVMPKEGAMTINSQQTLDMMRERDEQFINKNITVLKKEKAESSGSKWTEDEASTKELIAELFYSRNTWEEDFDSNGKDKLNSVEKYKKIFSKEQNVAALAKILKNPELIKETLNRISFLLEDVKDEKGKRREAPADLVKNLTAVLIEPYQKIEINENTKVEDIVNAINKTLKNKDIASLKSFEACYNSLSFMLGDFMRSKMNEIQDKLKFLVESKLVDKKNAPQKQEENEEDIHIDEALKEPTAKLRKLQDQTLIKQLNKNNLTGQTGQAQFLQKLLSNYFSQVCDIDQRSIIASMFREASPMPLESEKKIVEPDYSDIDESKMQANVVAVIKDEKRREAEEKTKKYEQQYKENIERADGSCLAGMVKGAGPLFQKILQGIQMDGVPRLLKNAMTDVRSNLLPIPDEIVKARLGKLIKDSNGKITKIDITNSQGAASVAQTFLARIYGPEPDIPKEGKEVVIKMLRPDIQTRMEREVDIIEGLAKEVGEAVELSYHGTYMRIQEELDFNAEEKNIRFGDEHYNKTLKINVFFKNNVHSMKVCPEDNNESDIMLLEKADGMTLDRYISQEKNIMAKNFNEDFDFDEVGNLDTDNVTSEGILHIFNVSHDKGYYLRQKATAAKLIHNLQTRQKHLVELVEKWITQAFYETGKNGEYFFHGDLHTGNIMIDKDSATLIDYGNATFLSSNQRTAMLNLIAAASAMRDVKKPCQWALRELVNSVQTKNGAEKKAILSDYETKEDELLRIVEKIFTKGSTSTIGIKLALVFSEMQNMGIPLPPSVANYAQAQIRIQNSIDSYNTLIKEAKIIHESYDHQLKKGEFLDDFSFNYSDKLSEYLSDYENEDDKQAHRDFYKAAALSYVLTGTINLSDALEDTTAEGIKDFENIFMGKYLLDRKDEAKNEQAQENYAEIQALYANYRKLQKNLKPDNEESVRNLNKAVDDLKDKLVDFYSSYVNDFNEFTDDDGNQLFSEFRTPSGFFTNVLATVILSVARQTKTKTGKRKTIDMSSSTTGDEYVLNGIRTLFGDEYNSPKMQEIMKDFKTYRDEWRALEKKSDAKNLNRLSEKVCLEALKLYLKKVDTIDGNLNNIEFDKDNETTFSEAVANVIMNNKLSTTFAVGTWGAQHAEVIGENFGFI